MSNDQTSKLNGTYPWILFKGEVEATEEEYDAAMALTHADLLNCEAGEFSTYKWKAPFYNSTALGITGNVTNTQERTQSGCCCGTSDSFTSNTATATAAYGQVTGIGLTARQYQPTVNIFGAGFIVDGNLMTIDIDPADLTSLGILNVDDVEIPFISCVSALSYAFAEKSAYLGPPCTDGSIGCKDHNSSDTQAVGSATWVWDTTTQSQTFKIEVEIFE